MASGTGRKANLLSTDNSSIDVEAVATKRSRVCSSDIDNHWKSVSSSTPSETQNHELPYVNNLLKELHFYRQARKTSKSMTRTHSKNKPTSIILSTVEDINGMDISSASIDNEGDKNI